MGNMNWDWDVTYTPGAGYTGYLPGCGRVAVRWGDEFRAMLEEQAAQYAEQLAGNKAPLDRSVTMGSGGAYDPLEVFERRQLTKDELAELAAELSAKYDPTNMTQEEYDELLFELADRGILSENELGPMGLHGSILVGSLLPGGTGWNFIGSCTVATETLHSNPYYQRYGNATSLYDTKGNALAYAELMVLRKPTSGTAGWMAFAEKRHSSFVALANVLKAMQSQRKG